MLLRTLLAELTGSDPATIEISQQCPDCGGAHGKPEVLAPAGFHASVAHCAEGTVVAISSVPVGVDVELRAGRDDREWAINQVAGVSADPLRHWTRIEAVLKADGRGLRVDPRSVAVTADEATLNSRSYQLRGPDLEAGWVVSVAVALGLSAVRAVPS